jgi:hypothetical protein
MYNTAQLGKAAALTVKMLDDACNEKANDKSTNEKIPIPLRQAPSHEFSPNKHSDSKQDKGADNIEDAPHGRAAYHMSLRDDKNQPARLSNSPAIAAPNEVDDWLHYTGDDVSYGFGEPGDRIAVSKHGLLQPRQLAVMKRKGNCDGVLCVYLGGIFPDQDRVDTGCYLFCDYRANDEGELPSEAVPFTALHFVARVIGVAGIKTPWRSLEGWKLPEREHELVVQLEAQLQPVRGPMQAFDIAMMQSGSTVH